jgi:hypothetical protein
VTSLGILSKTTHLCSSKNTSHSSLDLCFIQIEIGRDLVHLIWSFAYGGTSSSIGLRISCYSWRFPPPRWLGTAMVVEEEFVIVLRL